MHDLESQLLDLAPVKPYLWLRYTDDILMIWTAGEEQLQEFLRWINQYHDTIKSNSKTVSSYTSASTSTASIPNTCFSYLALRLHSFNRHPQFSLSDV